MRHMKQKKKKHHSSKGNHMPLNVSSMQGDDKPQNDVSNEIHVGGQLGYPQESVKNKKKKTKKITGVDLLKKRITFADFRQKSNEMKYGRNSI